MALSCSKILALSFCLFEQSRGKIFWRVGLLAAIWLHPWGVLQGDYTLDVNEGQACVLSCLLLKASLRKALEHRILLELL